MSGTLAFALAAALLDSLRTVPGVAWRSAIVRALEAVYRRQEEARGLISSQRRRCA
ncbi:MAG: hypothetical protein LZF60_50204 [Nitrospira sp.]|nr:MAG: hypothetical protein LZF60_50204 [Nitrospira sp.]